MGPLQVGSEKVRYKPNGEYSRGTADDLSGYTHEATGPSESHPAGPEAESHGAAASVQERSVTLLPEFAHLGFLLSPAEGGVEACGHWGWVLLPKHKLLPHDICGQ